MKKGFDYTGITTPFFCHDGAGKYLFHKRSTQCRDEHGTWDTGGGGLEFGLTLEENVRKEIREEYGTEAFDLELLGFREVHRVHDGLPTHWIAFDFKARIDPKDAKRNEPDMQDEIAWFTLDVLPEPLHSQLPLALEKYRDKL